MKEVKALYIHIPFCISKCKYCDFFSVPLNNKKNSIPDSYLTALCSELAYRIKKYNIKKLETIYIGGGTPSLLNGSQLDLIFSAIRENTVLDEGCEITIEANPDDITEEFINILNNSDVNRISLGLQSFCNKALSYVSRRATCEINRQALGLLKEYWHRDLSVDFICGLPQESGKDFLGGLDYILSYKPEHISMYSLTIEQETPLGCELFSGKLNYNFDFADELWLKSKSKLEKGGYCHYEVSNFCIPGKECRHNLKYWNHEGYIGCGSGGTGSVYDDNGAGFRWTNTTDIKEYCGFWNNFSINHFPGNFISCPDKIQAVETIPVETSIFEFFMMGLRKLSGISSNNFYDTFRQPVPENILNAFKCWSEKNLCEIKTEGNDTIYTLGHNGILYLNSFLEDII